MNTTITLSFRYSERDYVRALRAHYASRLRLPLDIVVTVGVAAMGIYLWRSSDLHWLGIAAVVLAVSFGLLLLAAFTVIPVVIFRRQPKFRDEYLLEFSAEGVHFRTASIDSRLQWGIYARALIDRHSYVMYYGAQQITVIPKRVFDSGEQQQGFERLLTEHVPQIIRRGVPRGLTGGGT